MTSAVPFLLFFSALCSSSSFRFDRVWRMSRLDGTAEPVSRDQILRRERGQGNIHFPCSADHEQDWQPYSVDTYSAIPDGPYILGHEPLCPLHHNVVPHAPVPRQYFPAPLDAKHPSVCLHTSKSILARPCRRVRGSQVVWVGGHRHAKDRTSPKETLRPHGSLDALPAGLLEGVVLGLG